ncbi:hypothetical protein AB0P28_05955 [Pseudarthrobacter sp. NPDC089323]
MDFNPDTWGTVADWVGGLGTTAAFLVTGFVVYRDAKERRSAQARQVAYFLRRPTNFIYKSLKGEEVRVEFFVSNMSPEPIYDVVHYHHLDTALGILDYKDVILPQETHALANQGYIPPEVVELKGSPPLLRFRDNSGHVWIRSVSGYVHPAGKKWTNQALPADFNKSAPGLDHL